MHVPPPTRVLAAAMLVLLTACGGGGGDDGDTAAPDASEAGGTREADSDEPSGPPRELVASGEPTPFEAVAGPEIPLDVGEDGSCATTGMVTLDDKEPFFGLCQVFDGDGGRFVVLTVSRDIDDHDTGLLCESDGAFDVVATVRGTGTPASTTLQLDGLGTIAVLTIHDDFIGDAAAAEGVIVAQPSGQTCPVVHGLGPVEPGLSKVRSRSAVVEVDSPDGLRCTTYDGTSFTTAPAPAGSTACPDPG